MAVERITELTIKGFKSFKSVDSFPLHRFNVLIGANGSGKSNFIDFFRMLNFAFGSSTGNLQLYAARKGRANSILHYGAKFTLNLDGAIKFDGVNQWSRYSFRLGWGAPAELFYARELLEYQREGKDSLPRQKQLGSGHLESEVLKQADKKEGIALSTVAKVFRDRHRAIRVYHFHDTSDESRVRLSQGMNRDQYLMSDAGNLAVFLYNLKQNKTGHYRKILETVQLVAPFIDDFILEPKLLNEQSLLFRWKDHAGDIFGPHQLSDGTIRAIALITALLQPDEAMPSIMLFDEPELGLHPSAIQLISTLLKSASEKRQIIVSTQSAILIRNYQPEDIIVVDRSETEKGRGESTLTRLETDQLAAWLEDFDLGKLYEKNVTGGGPL